MQLSIPTGHVLAAEALRKAIGVAPLVRSRQTTRGALNAFYWRTPWLGSYDLNNADEVILALHTGGSRSVRTRVKNGWSDWSSTPGQLHVIPARHTATFKPDGRLEFVSLHFSRERLADLIGNEKASTASLPFRFAFDDAFARNCVTTICDELRDPREHGSLLVDSLMDALWCHLLRSDLKTQIYTPSIPSGIARAKERIEESLTDGVALDELAQDAGISRFYFARAFRDAVGEPPHKYLTRRRIEKAKKLLLSSDTALSELALSVGFSSQSHFSSVFRKLVGQSPRQYRINPN